MPLGGYGGAEFAWLVDL